MVKVNKKSLLKKLSKLDIRVFGFPYAIEFQERLLERFNVTGCAQVWGHQIQIDPGISSLDILSSIMHEIVEVMFRKTETPYRHDIISKIETFLMLVIIENPELLELILETTKKEARSIKDGAKQKAKRMEKIRKGKSRI